MSQSIYQIYPISCKKCYHGKRIKNNKYIGCQIGKGIFLNGARFSECSGYIYKKDHEKIKQYKEDQKAIKTALKKASDYIKKEVE